MNVFGELKFLCFLFLLLGNIFSAVAEEAACKNATVILSSFWEKMNNAQHGTVIYINLKNYYCAACAKYLPTWLYLQEEMEKVEMGNVTLFTFDCACSSIMPYCVAFHIEFYPTFRIVYPVYKKDLDDKKVNYIDPLTPIGGQLYEGNLTLAYQETDRMNSISDIQRMLKQKLCNNILFNSSLLKSCVTDTVVEEAGFTNARYMFENLNGAKNLRSQKWNIEKKEHSVENDIFLGLLFTLRNNVTKGNDVNLENIQTLLLMLETLTAVYPHLSEDINKTIASINSMNFPVSRTEWQSAVGEMQIKDYKVQEKLAFTVCEEDMLLCSFWMLYHKLSIHSLLHDSNRYLFFRDLIVKYTKEYLNCQECIQHFLDIQKKCYFGACSIQSAELLVIFLWRVHNSVTLRTVCESITVDLENASKLKTVKGKYVNVDVAFPSEKQCPQCRVGPGLTYISLNFVKNFKNNLYSEEHFDAIDAFDISQVIQYLIRYYE